MLAVGKSIALHSDEAPAEKLHDFSNSRSVLSVVEFHLFLVLEVDHHVVRFDDVLLTHFLGWRLQASIERDKTTVFRQLTDLPIILLAPK